MNGDLDLDFEIPELPYGQLLQLELLSNWGDANYIGLNAVEVFVNTGKRADVAEISSSSSLSFGDLPSIFIESQPSSDIGHMWKTSLDTNATIDFRLAEPARIAMIRIWNYNEQKSRVHAQIGVKEMRILLDGKPIFQGEINPAHTSDHDFEPMGDTVLFTTDERILEAIAENDVCLVSPEIMLHQSSLDFPAQDQEPVTLTPFRPPTAETTVARVPERPSSARSLREETDNCSKVKVIHLELIMNWGHPDLIGLTGFELIGFNGKLLQRKCMTVTAPGCLEGVERLINGQNLSRTVNDMWLTPLAAEGKKPPSITIQLNQPEAVAGISFWNYNASPEMSFAGVRILNIYINGKQAVSNVLLRKAPGFVYFDFVQDIFFDSPTLRPGVPRPRTQSIGGFIFHLRLLSTWGDEFYIGLNGIELFNRKDEPIKIKTHNLAAFPESINILPAVEGDPRGSENIIDGVNDTDNPAHMWLTPLLPNRCARVFFIFDVPTYVSRMVIYNYRKTPERGARHVSLSVDDIIVHSGEIPMSSPEATGILSIDLRESS